MGGLSNADAVRSAVDIFFWKNDIEERNEGKLMGDVVCVDGRMSCEAKDRYDFEDTDDGARV